MIINLYIFIGIPILTLINNFLILLFIISLNNL